MNQDELLELCFGSDLPTPRKWLSMTEPDDDDPSIIHTRATLGLDYRRVIVRNSQPASAGIGVAMTTVPVAAVLYVCTDPEHRGRGFATALVLSAHEEAGSHRSTPFSVVIAPDRVRDFFTREELGYFHPELAPDGFLVCELGGRDPEWAEWPPGSVRAPGDW